MAQCIDRALAAGGSDGAVDLDPERGRLWEFSLGFRVKEFRGLGVQGFSVRV